MTLSELRKKLKMAGAGVMPVYCCECLRDVTQGIKVVIDKDDYCAKCASEYFKAK